MKVVAFLISCTFSNCPADWTGLASGVGVGSPAAASLGSSAARGVWLGGGELAGAIRDRFATTSSSAGTTSFGLTAEPVGVVSIPAVWVCLGRVIMYQLPPATAPQTSTMAPAIAATRGAKRGPAVAAGRFFFLIFFLVLASAVPQPERRRARLAVGSSSRPVPAAVLAWRAEKRDARKLPAGV